MSSGTGLARIEEAAVRATVRAAVKAAVWKCMVVGGVGMIEQGMPMRISGCLVRPLLPVRNHDVLICFDYPVLPAAGLGRQSFSFGR